MRSISFVILVWVLLLARVASADTALEQIEPRVDRRAYLQFVDQLHLDDDHRLIADLLYSDYAVALEDLAAQISAREAEAGKQRVDDALAGRIFIDRDELRTLRVAVLRVGEAVWTSADELMAELMESVESLVTDERADFEAAVRALRRSVYLQPHLGRQQDDQYAGEAVDVVRLVEEARADDGELAGLDARRLSPILDEYVRAHVAHLATTADADRRGRLRLAIARIERDTTGRAQAEREAIERWKELHRISVDAVEAIAASLGDAGAQQAWRTRFDRACFPRLFRPTKAEREHDWILRFVSDEQLRARARSIQAEYERSLNAMCREAVETMLSGRLEMLVPIHPRMDPSRLDNDRARRLYQELLKNSGRRASLDADTCSALEALITKRQRKQMASDIAAAAYGRRR